MTVSDKAPKDRPAGGRVTVNGTLSEKTSGKTTADKTTIDEITIAAPSETGPWRHLHHSLGKAFADRAELCGLGGGLVARHKGEAGVLFVCRSCRQCVTEALADFITRPWENALLLEQAAWARPDLNEAELLVIRGAAQQLLLAAEKETAGKQAPRREFVRQRLQDYLQDHDRINLEGFITFRLQHYVGQLESAVDAAFGEFLTTKEYRDLIRLLKIFVDSQPDRVGLVHVLRGAGGGFQLVDADGQAVDQQSLATLVTGVGRGPMHYGDLLVSALISLAPRRVLLHNPAPYLAAETVDTIKLVFADRVHMCQGCRTCRDQRRHR